MCEPLVTLLIPVYNKELYIKRCIDSLLKQTYKNLSVVFVDDGSTDNSPHIIKKATEKDNRFFFYRINHGGVSSARNELIKHVHGDYFMFIDADDLLVENACELLVKICLDNNFDILHFKLFYDGECGGNMKNSDTDKVVIEKQSFWLKEYNYIRQKNKYNLNCNLAHCKIFKNYLKDYIYFEGIKSEDFFFAYKPISFAKRIGFFDKSLYNYHYVEDSLIHTEYTLFDHAFVIHCWCQRIIFYKNNVKSLKYVIPCKAHAISLLYNLTVSDDSIFEILPLKEYKLVTSWYFYGIFSHPFYYMHFLIKKFKLFRLRRKFLKN